MRCKVELTEKATRRPIFRYLPGAHSRVRRKTQPRKNTPKISAAAKRADSVHGEISEVRLDPATRRLRVNHRIAVVPSCVLQAAHELFLSPWSGTYLTFTPACARASALDSAVKNTPPRYS